MLLHNLPPGLPSHMKGTLLTWANEQTGRAEVRAIGLTGSWVRGKAGPRSDIDTLLVTTGQCLHRYSTWVNGVEIQAIEGPVEWFHRAFEERVVGTVQRMLCDCAVLWDPDGLLGSLAQAGRELTEAGPEPPDANRVRSLRFRVTEALDDLLDALDSLIESTPTALLCREDLIRQLLDAFWVTRHVWPEKTKYAFESIKRIDPDLSDQLTNLLRASRKSEISALAISCCEAILKPVGGLLRESWRKQPERVKTSKTE